MLATLRLTWRLQRWELAILGLAGVGLAGALVVIAWQMGAIQAATPECWARDSDAPLEASLMATCEGPLGAYEGWRGPGDIASLGVAIAPFALGVVLGVPLVAREIESRTAGITWSLSRSRLRWLALRVLPVVGFVLLVITLVSLSGNVLLTERLDGREPGFGEMIAPWPIAVTRGLVVLGIGLTAGALLGRTLPALLVALGVTGALFIGLAFAFDAWMASEAEPIDVGPDQREASRIFEMGFRDDETNELITMNEYYSAAGNVMTASEPEGMTMIAWQIPAEEHPAWVAREAAVVGGVAVLFGIGSVAVVVRRRPA